MKSAPVFSWWTMSSLPVAMRLPPVTEAAFAATLAVTSIAPAVLAVPARLRYLPDPIVTVEAAAALKRTVLTGAEVSVPV